MRIFCTLLFTVFSMVLSAQDFTKPSDNMEPATTNFKLYPNPAYDGTVFITTKDNLVKDIFIFDIFGAMVLQDRIASTQLNISKLSPGVYALQVTENQKVMTRKLVIK